MTKYASIETLYRRTPDNKLDFEAIREPEWNLIRGWYLTEKVDGTNIRVVVTGDGIEIRGRTDNANLPGGVEAAIRAMIKMPAVDILNLANAETVIFYGEGYGPGIKGSDPMEYRTQAQGKSFIGFDVLLGETRWADNAQWQDLSEAVGLPMVPTIGYIEEVPCGFDEAESVMNMLPESIVALNESGKSIKPEGLVARPILPLFNRYGGRIMWKLTNRDMRK